MAGCAGGQEVASPPAGVRQAPHLTKRTPPGGFHLSDTVDAYFWRKSHPSPHAMGASCTKRTFETWGLGGDGCFVCHRGDAVRYAQAISDDGRDMGGVFADPSDEAGSKSGLKRQSDEVESRLALGDPATVAREPIGSNHRHLDP